MADEESQLVAERRRKLGLVRSAGRTAYPYRFADVVATGTVATAARALEPGAEDLAQSFAVAGRLGAIRQHGKSAFLDLQDRDGSLQLFARVDELGEAGYQTMLDELDPGDIVGAVGRPVRTKRGEPSLRVTRIELLAKALRPPPEKWHGLQDEEARIRHRHVDLFASRESRARFRARSLLTAGLRNFLTEAGFLEVETGVLSSVASGAAARPFVTHSHYLNDELRLRVALELQLKRLLIGGLERVFELGPVFRNEDLDSTHSPEFTMMECYWAYADYTDMRGLVERLYERLAHVAAAALPDVPGAKAAPEVFRPPFDVVDYVETLERAMGRDGLLDAPVDELRRLARATGVAIADDAPAGKCFDKLFDKYVEPTLLRPTFVMDYPTATSPLAKAHRSRPGRIERFELFYRGFELGNAYSELNDPDEQRRRFLEQAGDDPDAHFALDEEFVEALEHGMPPASGLGIGVERMAMALTGTSSIKDLVLFPPTRRRR
ncbi:MAG: lysine--tRNA ligase [Thermoplasmata archaeon]|nr:lysine--tRNA ligase [Thermoplasmata archaeon]MCI4362142.1 lysine--tRNA ligase [Thermoplasmata archaeon]